MFGKGTTNNLKKTLIYLCLVFNITACNFYNEGAPEDLIPPDKMALILLEIHKTETLASRMSYRTYDSAKIAYDYLESNLLKKFDVDTAQYRTSYEYYASNPEQFVRIYEDIEEMLANENE